MAASHNGLTTGVVEFCLESMIISTEPEPQITLSPDPHLHAASQPGQGRSVKERGNDRCSKKVYVAFLPERYKPLVEEDEMVRRVKEEKKQKRRGRYKKYRKNLGKALRFSWKCFIAGLQSFSAGYSTPATTATILITHPHRTQS
ncbi:hypothetical protein GJAV_G00000150 [Gymnothorax javanicus]|nr:hypothetical protein GJAV_G00000150 [Gymnothorax javanicus]